MPDTLSAADARRDAALKRAYAYHGKADQLRRIAAMCKTPGPWLDLAAAATAMADFIYLCWRESHRC